MGVRTLARCLCCLAILTPGWGQAPQSTEQSDRLTGLIISVPPEWRLDDWPAFAIVNFAPSERPKQWIVPEDGAQIVVMGAGTGIKTVPDWLRADRAASGPQETKSVHISDFGDVAATVVDRDLSAMIPDGRSVAYYFLLGDQPVKVSLLYRGESRAAYFKSVQQDVIAHLRRRE